MQFDSGLPVSGAGEESLILQPRHQAALAELGQLALVGSQIDVLLDRCVWLIGHALRVDFADAYELQSSGRTLRLRAVMGWDGRRAAETTLRATPDSLPGHALLNDAPVLSEDIASDPRFNASPIMAEQGVVSAVAVTIHGQGRPFGVLGAHTTSRRRFTRGELYFMQAVAHVLAQAIARNRAEEALQRHGIEGAVIAEIGRVVGSSLNIEEVYERFADLVRSLIPFDHIVISTVDLEEGTAAQAYIAGLPLPAPTAGEPMSLSGTLVEAGVRAGSAVYANGAENALEEYADFSPEAAGVLKSALLVPLISKGVVIGALTMASAAPNMYADRDIALAERVGAQIAGAIVNARLYVQALQLAEEREKRALLDAENRELQRVNEEKSRFLSAVSHELRTPLTSMIAFTDILLHNREKTLTPRQLRHLEVMQRSGRHLKLLIGDLLDLSRIGAGTCKLDRHEFDAAPLFGEIAESFAPILEAKKQTLETSMPPGSLWVTADRDRLVQVISNLLSNASKYSPESTRIELAGAGEDGHLEVTIRDHGIGISKRDQRKLFTTFFRADNSETQAVPGLGLGLVIVKTIVELHGGRISVESARGAGTTVRLHIPPAVPDAGRAGP